MQGEKRLYRGISVRVLIFLVFLSGLLTGCTWLGDLLSPNQAPVAVISATPTSGETPLEVTFDASGSYDPDGDELVTHRWVFGDGNFSEAPVAAHVFEHEGTYVATLTISDSKNEYGTSSIAITVSKTLQSKTDSSGIAKCTFDNGDFEFRIVDDEGLPIPEILCEVLSDSQNLLASLSDPSGQYIPRIVSWDEPIADNQGNYAHPRIIWSETREWVLHEWDCLFKGGSHLVYDDRLPTGLTRAYLEENYKFWRGPIRLDYLQDDILFTINTCADIVADALVGCILSSFAPGVGTGYSYISLVALLEDLDNYAATGEIVDKYRQQGYQDRQEFEIWVAKAAQETSPSMWILPLEYPALSIPENQPPVADAVVLNQVVEVGETIELDGSASYDLDHDNPTFLWSQVSGPAQVEWISAPRKPLVSVRATIAGSYEFQLIVNDGKDDSAPAVVGVIVQDSSQNCGEGQTPYVWKEAVAYANEWWDGFNDETQGGPYEIVYGWYDGKKVKADCANFVSQCLIAGGIDLTRMGTLVAEGKGGTIKGCALMDSYFRNCLQIKEWSKINLENNRVPPSWFLPGDVAIVHNGENVADMSGNHALIAVGWDAFGEIVFASHSPAFGGQIDPDPAEIMAQFLIEYPRQYCTYYHIPACITYTTTSPAPTELAAPTPLSPGSHNSPGDTIDTLTPTLTWSASEGADRYAVAISKYPYEENLIWPAPDEAAVLVTGTSTEVPAGRLQYDTKYRWNVRALSDTDKSVWSNRLYFQTPHQTQDPPGTVTLTLYVHDGSASGPTIQGARVQGTDADGNSFNEYTNSSGFVTITGTPGMWSFTASKSGYDNNSWSQSITSTTTKQACLMKHVTSKTLDRIAISGPSEVNENSSADYTCTAYFSDGSSSDVTTPANWSENSTYTTISSSGRLSVASLPSDKTCTVMASYTYDGVARSASKLVVLKNKPEGKILDYLTCSGPIQLAEGATGQFSCTAHYNDGSYTDVTNAATWTVTSSYATISSSGVLSVGDLPSDQPCDVKASYTNEGVTRSCTTSLTLKDEPITVTAKITFQDATPSQVQVGEGVSFICRVRNTGNTTHTFHVALTLRRPDGTLIDLEVKPETIAPGQTHQITWSYNPDQPGGWDMIFGVWKDPGPQNALHNSGWLYDAVTVLESAVIDAQIDTYSPNNSASPITVEVGLSTNISVTFRNTGNTAWPFIAGAFVWNSSGQIVADYSKTLSSPLGPGQQTTVSWNHTVSQPGDYWLQFGVWKQTPYVSENLLHKAPSPSQRLIVGVTASKFHIGDRVRVTTNLNVRTCPSIGCSEIVDPGYPGYAPTGTLGIVVDGPVSADGYIWWKIQYDPGYVGWSVEGGLQRV